MRNANCNRFVKKPHALPARTDNRRHKLERIRRKEQGRDD